MIYKNRDGGLLTRPKANDEVVNNGYNLYVHTIPTFIGPMFTIDPGVNANDTDANP